MSNPRKSAKRKPNKKVVKTTPEQVTMSLIPARERADYVAWYKDNHSPKEHELFLAGGGHTPTEFLNPTQPSSNT